MDLIRIDNNKMKIMLTPVDMQSYALDTADMNADSRRTRTAFRHILDDVRARTGFDALDTRLYVQLYPSREGGCEMFVTKLGLCCTASDADERSRAASHAPLPEARPRRTGNEHERTAAFSFEKLEYLLSACRRLHLKSFSGSSSAYHDEAGRYYLILSNRCAGLSRLERLESAPFSLVSEYGTRQNADTVRAYIREHGRPICEKNAVARLGNL
jgi:negative regulator of genetic competence, sporulation and motility